MQYESEYILIIKIIIKVSHSPLLYDSSLSLCRGKTIVRNDFMHTEDVCNIRSCTYINKYAMFMAVVENWMLESVFVCCSLQETATRQVFRKRQR